MNRGVALLALLLAAASVAAGDAPQAAPGTTIIGERESAIGLYLAPWQDEPAGDLDRPPALFDLPAAPVDADDLARIVQYRDQIEAYRRERLFRSR